MRTPSFAHEIGESALAGVGRNNICEYLLFKMALGRHENTIKHQVLYTKLENLQWQGWAGIIFANIFYLKWLWEGMKTLSFAHEIGESALAEWAGIIFVNIFYLKCLERKRPFQIENIHYTNPKFSEQDCATNHFLNRRYSVG